MKKLLRRPAFAGKTCLFSAMAAVLAAAVFFSGCEMDVSESPVLDEIEAAYRGLQDAGGGTGSGGQTGGETSGGGSENPSPAPGHSVGSVFKSGGISYLVLSDGSLQITGIDSQIREVTVPGTVDGHPVRDIDAGIFRNNHNLAAADFSQAVYLEKLGANLFGNVDRMETADFSGCKSLVTVGAYAFENCHALRKADFPDCPALERINDGAFQNCDRMETADFSGCTSLREIGNYAFANCNNLKEVDLSGCPDLESIAQNAFENCGQLEILHLCGSTGNLSQYGIPDIRNDVAVYVQDEEEISALPFLWREQAEPCPEHR